MTDVVNVDLRRGSLIVISYSTTTAGFDVMNGWFVSLTEAVTDEVLGTNVLDALARCRQGIPVPPRDSRLSAPLLKAVGVRSWAQYMKDVREVGVRRDGKTRIVATENCGRDGFVEVADATVTIARDPARAELGRAVRDALARSR